MANITKLNNTEIWIDKVFTTNKGPKVALVYPNEYFLGMSNLGFQGLFYNFIKVDELHINRFFFSSKSNNKISSPENHFSLSQAQVILISFSFELDFINIIKMLLANGIEPHSNKRISPFIGVGGAFANLNPDFCLSFADIIFRGEFECYINELISLCLLPASKNKSVIIDFAHKLMDKFIYDEKTNGNNIPIYQNLKEPNYSNILTSNTSFPNTLLVEISRGCLFKCSFCIVPSLYGKIRHFNKNELFKVLDMGLAKVSRVGLVSALTTEHPDLKELVYYINRRGAKVSFSSLRIEAIDDELLHLIRDNSQNTLTIAPEVASNKLKKKIRKLIKTDNILNLFERGLKIGFKRFKLYFIIGFEDEDQGDLYSIVDLVIVLRSIALAYAKEFKYMPEIILSINQFIPKPYSKLSGGLFLNRADMLKKIQYIKKHLLPLGIIIKEGEYIKDFFQWYFAKGSRPDSDKVINLIVDNPSKKGLYRVLSKLV